MIYTVGFTESYTKGLKAATKANPLKKVGPYTDTQRGPYEGGIAFKTVSDAIAYLRVLGHEHDYSVYALKGCWAKDVYTARTSDGLGPPFRINKDLLIIKKVDENHGQAKA